MSSLEETVEQMSVMSDALMAAIGRTKGADNIHVIMGALGSVVGCMAMASGRPDECLEVMTRTARGVITGELLS